MHVACQLSVSSDFQILLVLVLFTCKYKYEFISLDVKCMLFIKLIFCTQANEHKAPMQGRPVPIPHFTADTDIRYLLSISDTGLINRYLKIVTDMYYCEI